MKKRCMAIVLSAGQGKRMGTSIQKQYIELCGKPIICYCLEAFEKSEIIDDVIMVVGAGQEDYVTEEIVNKWIAEALPVTTEEMDIEHAKLTGATALFGEKYEDVVRVVSMGNPSLQLPVLEPWCGTSDNSCSWSLPEPACKSLCWVLWSECANNGRPSFQALPKSHT